MTKQEIIKQYIDDLNNIFPDSDSKRNRIIFLEDRLESLKRKETGIDVCDKLIEDFCNGEANFIELTCGLWNGGYKACRQDQLKRKTKKK